MSRVQWLPSLPAWLTAPLMVSRKRALEEDDDDEDAMEEEQKEQQKPEEPAVKKSKPSPPCPQCRAGIPGKARYKKNQVSAFRPLGSPAASLESWPCHHYKYLIDWTALHIEDENYKTELHSTFK